MSFGKLFYDCDPLQSKAQENGVRRVGFASRGESASAFQRGEFQPQI
jgi:hypothetical protein